MKVASFFALLFLLGACQAGPVLTPDVSAPAIGDVLKIEARSTFFTAALRPSSGAAFALLQCVLNPVQDKVEIRGELIDGDNPITRVELREDNAVVKTIEVKDHAFASTWSLKDTKEPFLLERLRALQAGQLRVHLYSAKGLELQGALQAEQASAVYTVRLNGANAVPAVETAATALAQVVVNPNQIRIEGQSQGLSAAAKSVRLMRGAPQQAGQLLAELDRQENRFSLLWNRAGALFSQGFNTEQFQALAQGEWSLSIQTAQHPQGEIRAWLKP